MSRTTTWLLLQCNIWWSIYAEPCKGSTQDTRPIDRHSSHFLSPQPDTSLHCQTMDMRLVHRHLCSFWWYSLHLPTKGWPGWVNLGAWLHTHQSTNQAQLRLTTLMRPTMLPIKPTLVINRSFSIKSEMCTEKNCKNICFHCKEISLKLKGEAYRSCAKSCLTYSSETWPMENEAKLDSGQMCGFSLKDKFTKIL